MTGLTANRLWARYGAVVPGASTFFRADISGRRPAPIDPRGRSAGLAGHSPAPPRVSPASPTEYEQHHQNDQQGFHSSSPPTTRSPDVLDSVILAGCSSSVLSVALRWCQSVAYWTFVPYQWTRARYPDCQNGTPVPPAVRNAAAASPMTCRADDLSCLPSIRCRRPLLPSRARLPTRPVTRLASRARRYIWSRTGRESSSRS